MEWIGVGLAGPYNVAYLAAFAFGAALAVRAGRGAGWPQVPWLALVAACVAAGIAGSKLLHFDLTAAHPGEKTILGGVLGAALVLLVLGRALGFDRTIFDRLVPALAVGFAAGRVGCFLAGCCFGRTTTLPWGISYGRGTEPYQHQLGGGLITPAAGATLPVHPTQLYEAVLTLFVAWVVHRFASRLTRDGSRFLAFAAGFGAMRFAIEPLRAGGSPVYGLTAVQWSLIAAVAIVLCLLYRRETASLAVAAVRRVPEDDLARSLPILLGVPVLALIGAGWLTPLEQLTLLVASLPGLTLVGTCWIRRGLLAPAPALAGLVVMLQVPPQDFFLQEDSYVTLGGSAMRGSYVETCGGAHRYTAAGASLGYTRVSSPTAKWSAHGQVFGGRDVAVDRLPQDGNSELLLGVGVRGHVDRRLIGIGAGVSGGRLVLDGGVESMIPNARVRLGPLSGIHLEGRLFDHEPAGFPAPAIQLGLGYGSGVEGSSLRAGVSDAGFFAGGRLVTRGGFEIEPFLAHGGTDVYQAGLTLRQRLGWRR